MKTYALRLFQNKTIVSFVKNKSILKKFLTLNSTLSMFKLSIRKDANIYLLHVYFGDQYYTLEDFYFEHNEIKARLGNISDDEKAIIEYEISRINLISKDVFEHLEQKYYRLLDYYGAKLQRKLAEKHNFSYFKIEYGYIIATSENNIHELSCIYKSYKVTLGTLIHRDLFWDTEKNKGRSHINFINKFAKLEFETIKAEATELIKDSLFYSKENNSVSFKNYICALSK